MKELVTVFVLMDTRTGEQIEYCVSEAQAKKKCKDNEELDYFEDKVMREKEEVE